MPKLTIPEDGYEGLHHIASLDGETFEAMREGLSKIPPTVYHIARIVQSISESTRMPEGTSASIGQTISGLALLYSRGGLTTKDFVDDVLSAVRAGEDEDLSFSEDDLTRLGNYLARLFELDNVVVSAIALDALLEVERPLAEARVFTDLRPVFARKADSAISAFAVTTTMKVAWFGPSGHHETYFTLDDADVDALLNALGEAKKQASSLRVFVESTGTQFVQIGER
jgi:hypothetical protein